MFKISCRNLVLVTLALIAVTFSCPSISRADNATYAADSNTAKAVVSKVLNEKSMTRDSGQRVTQQDLELTITTGSLAGQKVKYAGISDLDVVSANLYHVGDDVLVNYSRGEDGKNIFYIVDYVRQGSLLWLLILFIVATIAVGGVKGVRSLFSLFASFLVIMFLLIPGMLHGYDPLLIGVPICLLVIGAIIYITEGFNRKSHIATLSILASLLVTVILSFIFTSWSKLTGLAQEETTYLLDATKQALNFRNLLLISFVIGTLGVLDDVVIGQIEAVNQIRVANPSLKDGEVFKMSMEVGKSHLGAITNTLFLAYVGVALPLLMLFSLKNPPFITWSQIINNESIAIEVTRTLTGVIGLCLAIPISTFVAVKFMHKEGSDSKK